MPEPVGRIKACTECRQQKVRCDAFLDYSRPCSRCRADNLPCIISKTFQRRKRKTKAQLQYELDRLRDQIPESQARGLPSPEDVEGVDAASPEDDLIPRPSASRTASDESQSSRKLVAAPPSIAQRRLKHSNRVLDPAKIYQDGELTIRVDPHGGLHVLGEVEMDSATIEANYQGFLDNYAPYLEGLFDHSVTPYERYAKSPLLFWTMICVGSRRTDGDKTTFAKLGGAVVDLAFRSCIRPEQPLLVILSIIILCNWPVPTELSYKDPCQPLAGAALSLAIQNGLHLHFAEHEFIARSLDAIPTNVSVRPIAPSQTQDVHFMFRNRIWGYCLTVFSSTSVLDGLPPTWVTSSFRKPALFNEVAPLFPDGLAYRVTLTKIQNEAVNLVSGLAEFDSNGSETALSAVVSSFDDRMCAVLLPSDDIYHRVIQSAMRLVVLGLHYVVQPEPDHARIVHLYSVAKQLIELVVKIDGQDGRAAFYLPHCALRTITLAAHVILRIEKSSLKESLGVEDVEAAFFESINLIKRCSAGHDLYFMNTVVLTQLWMSDDVFVRDGARQNGLRVDLRHRLSLSVIYDGVRWWRKFLGGSQQRIYPANITASTDRSRIAHSNGNSNSNSTSTSTSTSTGNSNSNNNRAPENPPSTIPTPPQYPPFHPPQSSSIPDPTNSSLQQPPPNQLPQAQHHHQPQQSQPYKIPSTNPPNLDPNNAVSLWPLESYPSNDPSSYSSFFTATFSPGIPHPDNASTTTATLFDSLPVDDIFQDFMDWWDSGNVAPDLPLPDAPLSPLPRSQPAGSRSGDVGDVDGPDELVGAA